MGASDGQHGSGRGGRALWEERQGGGGTAPPALQPLRPGSSRRSSFWAAVPHPSSQNAQTRHKSLLASNKRQPSDAALSNARFHRDFPPAPHRTGRLRLLPLPLASSPPGADLQVEAELVAKGFSSYRLVRVSPDYYDQALDYRRRCLAAPSVDHLCKSIVMENTRAHPSVDGFTNPCNSKYYVVIIQVRGYAGTDEECGGGCGGAQQS